MSDAEGRQLPVQLDVPTLEKTDISTWTTDAGAFEVLPGLVVVDGPLVPHEELTERETLIDGQGFTIRAAALEDIIAAKERANRPKHREALSELRALRDTP